MDRGTKTQTCRLKFKKKLQWKLTVFLLDPTCCTKRTETAERKLWAWVLFLLGKRQRTWIFLFRGFSLCFLSPQWFRLAGRTRMKGCPGHVHMSWCTPTLCWPCGHSTLEPQRNQGELVPETIAAGSQCRYRLTATHQNHGRDAGKHRGTCLCQWSLGGGAGQGL